MLLMIPITKSPKMVKLERVLNVSEFIITVRDIIIKQTSGIIIA